MNTCARPFNAQLARRARATLRSGFAALLVAALALTMASSPSLRAGSNSLDPSFGTDGVVRTDFGDSERVKALAIQPDGKLVAAGPRTLKAPPGVSPPEPTDFAIARYDRDGVLDSSFGPGGKVTTDFDRGYDEATGLVVQPDGKLVVAGWSGRTGTPLTFSPAEFALARYNPDGTLDPEFGTRGRVMTSFGGHDEVSGLVLQPDGKVVVAGTSVAVDRSLPTWSIALARYTENGRLDQSFGSAGRIKTSFGFPDAEAHALVIQSDGKLVITGVARASAGGNLDFLLARFTPDGSLDTDFGTGGVVITSFSSHSNAHALALDRNGNLVTAGIMNNKDVALARYSPNGVLDPDFGQAGRVVLDFGGTDGAYALALDVDGNLLVAGGTGGTSSGLSADFLLLRLQPDGTLDDSFGIDGRLTADLGAPHEWTAALVIQPDGKPVAGGYGPSGVPASPSAYVSPSDFVLLRYTTD